jgi:hypothetical protein
MGQAMQTAAEGVRRNRQVPVTVQFHAYCCVGGFAVRSILSDSNHAPRKRA